MAETEIGRWPRDRKRRDEGLRYRVHFTAHSLKAGWNGYYRTWIGARWAIMWHQMAWEGSAVLYDRRPKSDLVTKGGLSSPPTPGCNEEALCDPCVGEQIT
jgi:hypothetical protein